MNFLFHALGMATEPPNPGTEEVKMDLFATMTSLSILLLILVIFLGFSMFFIL